MQADGLLDLHSFHSGGAPFVMVGPQDNDGRLEPFAHAATEEALARVLGVPRAVDGWLGTYASGVAAPAQQAPADGLAPEALPEPPPPQQGMELDNEVEQQVTIGKKGEDTVEEFRANGQLYMIKVTPPHGVPYYLYDDVGNGDFTRRDAQDSGIRVPKWVIKRW